jgi:hypothetical protein
VSQATELTFVWSKEEGARCFGGSERSHPKRSAGSGKMRRKRMTFLVSTTKTGTMLTGWMRKGMGALGCLRSIAKGWGLTFTSSSAH